MTTTYEVTVTRADGLWVASIAGEGLGPAATDVVRFADLDVEVRDLIAGLTDADPEDVSPDWRYVIDGEDVTFAVQGLLHAERNLRSAEELRQLARGIALMVLHGAGLPQSAIGDVLGVSHQRVHQLLKAS
jgi:hypothetical protein